MGTYIARRLLLMVPTLIGITFIVFMLVALSPGGIGALAGVSAGGSMEAGVALQQRAYLEDRYGLRDPVVVQYLRWLARISPVRFGQRDQMLPSGDLIRAPRAPEAPAARAWWEEAVAASARSDGTEPASPPRADPTPPADPPEGPDALRALHAERAVAHARANAARIVANADLETALRRYAQAAGLRGAIDRDQRPVERVFLRHPPDISLPEWSAVIEAGRAAAAAHSATLAARASLVEAIRMRPYPEVGVPLLPGLVWVAAPDLGVSYSNRRPVAELVARALPVTLLLNLVAFPIIYLVAIPSGMLAAARRGTWVDTVLGGFFVALWSVPTVWAGVLAIGYLASPKYLGWFPVTGLHDKGAAEFAFLPSMLDGAWQRGYLLDTLWHLVLPVTCLVYGGFAILSKQTRAAMLENLSADYVRTARAKGVARRTVLLRHVFRNSLLPLITMFVGLFPAMLSGSVVIERIFTIPGMGSLALDAIYNRDREVILATVTMIAAVNLVALLLADILYALADPRISYE